MGDLRSILTDIRQEHGHLDPEVVVEEATPEDSPLHHHFEWDDAIAGHKHRLSQARRLLRVTFVEVVEDKPERIRAFLPIRGEDPRSNWTPIEEVATDPVASAIVLRQMRREWATFRRRYEAHQEFLNLVMGDLGVDLPDGETG